MRINITEVKLPKVNMIILLFISFILANYKHGLMIHYLLFLICFCSIFLALLRGIKLNEEFGINKNLIIFYIILFLAFTFNSLSIIEIKVFIDKYLIICLIIIHGSIQFNKYGRKYGEQFFYQFTILMNIFSFLNIFQLVFHRPMLMMFLTDKMNEYQDFAYGTSAFRTISVFGHPIVSGLFFSLMFICNMYTIKGKFKYPLQMLALINIYSTLSRSAWIALSIVLLFYCIKKFRVGNIFNYQVKKSFTYKELLVSYSIIVFSIFFVGLLFMNFDQIVNTIISRFGNSLSSNSNDLSNLQRVGTIDLIIAQMFSSGIFDFFFGNGLGSVGNFMAQHPVVIQGFRTTDNMYLTIFFELGAISLIGYFVFLIISIFRFICFKQNWLYELSSLWFIFITIEIFFFEGIGWGVVGTVWAFTLLILSITFKSEKTNHSNILLKQTLSNGN
ncbi:hypothetical protein ABFY54_07010 [Priestia megaterium]|uniref:hypothetical protein n=1 Tax=Priestia megaterium TaxID=1404 RepID=UPI003D26B8BD